MSYIRANMRAKQADPFRSPENAKKKKMPSEKLDPYSQEAIDQGSLDPPARRPIAQNNPAAAPAPMQGAAPPAPAQRRTPLDPPPRAPMAPNNQIKGRDYFGARDRALDAKSDHKAAGLTKRHYGMNNELLSAKTPEGFKVTGEKRSSLPKNDQAGGVFDPPKDRKRKKKANA